MSTDHLALAREYIAKGDEFYARAADEIIAWLAEDPTRSQQSAADVVGRSSTWVGNLVRSRTSDPRADGLSVDWNSGSNKRDEVAERVLKDPEQRKQIIASMPTEARRVHPFARSAAAYPRSDTSSGRRRRLPLSDLVFYPATFFAYLAIVLGLSGWWAA